VVEMACMEILPKRLREFCANSLIGMTSMQVVEIYYQRCNRDEAQALTALQDIECRMRISFLAEMKAAAAVPINLNNFRFNRRRR